VIPTHDQYGAIAPGGWGGEGIRIMTSRPELLSELLESYGDVRRTTECLASPLSAEDQTVQTVPEVSPTKWHRAHVTWFFETFVLAQYAPDYAPFHPAFAYIFNSYYEAVGARHPRPERGLLSRPGVEEIARYRQHVDSAMTSLLAGPNQPGLAELVTLGLHHEQQHQELLLMDIKHVLSKNPLHPAYIAADQPGTGVAPPKAGWVEHDGGDVQIGHSGDGFGFDNEFPRHTVYLTPFGLADRPVTCGEWLEFMDAGGYTRSEFWLSDGWAVVNAEHWDAPLYWFRDPEQSDGWLQFTLAGVHPVDPDEPVSHVSYYEADAFAHWTGLRLPTEAEWESIAVSCGEGDNLLSSEPAHPRPALSDNAMFGDVWEWTSSAYSPYPGFRAAPGAVGEYNGKFMVSQYVLRGGCCATPRGHIRPTYRNFFPPGARWAFSGVRLARDP
jgi:ergothioneine biosynthesis protein EgtB